MKQFSNNWIRKSLFRGEKKILIFISKQCLNQILRKRWSSSIFESPYYLLFLKYILDYFFLNLLINIYLFLNKKFTLILIIIIPTTTTTTTVGQIFDFMASN